MFNYKIKNDQVMFAFSCLCEFQKKTQKTMMLFEQGNEEM